MNITYPRQVCQAIKNNFSIYCTPVYYQMNYIDNKHLQNGKSYVILKLYKLDRISDVETHELLNFVFIYIMTFEQIFNCT